MVNHSGSVPPNNGRPIHPQGTPETEENKKKEELQPGAMKFTETSHEWGGMTFTAEEWNKLMNILSKNFCDFMNKTFKKMKEKLKKDAQRMEGKDVD